MGSRSEILISLYRMRRAKERGFISGGMLSETGFGQHALWGRFGGNEEGSYPQEIFWIISDHAHNLLLGYSSFHQMVGKIQQSLGGRRHVELPQIRR